MSSPTSVSPLQSAVRSPRKWGAAAVSTRFSLDLRGLASFRIATGLILVADCLLRCRDFWLMFTPEGMFPHAALHAFTPSAANWSLAFLVDAAWWDGLVLGLEGLAGLALAVGFRTRVATIVAWVALVSVLRRTAPATNAGDLWLATLLLWGAFLPLGGRWSIDAVRRSQPAPPEHFSVASVAFTLQILVVYLVAGVSKCNGTWFSGHAVRDALSVHDHGTPLGAWVVQLPGVAELAGGLVLGLELAGPVLFLMVSSPRLRTVIAVSFLSFHGLVAMLMSVGLFAPIGFAAWLALVPKPLWDQLGRRVGSAPSSMSAALWQTRVRTEPGQTAASTGILSRAAFVGCGLLLLLAVADAIGRVSDHANPLPSSVQAAIDLACLRQEWEMFGTVPHQEQWAYARGLLADGSEIDLLRDGQPLQRIRPTGGFTTLPHHRWAKLLWVLPKPPLRVFSPSIARALAHNWNQQHPPDQHLRRLEICFARLTATDGIDAAERGVLHELVVATWPPRNATGAGNLDRLLEEHGD